MLLDETELHFGIAAKIPTAFFQDAALRPRPIELAAQPCDRGGLIGRRRNR